MQVHSAEYLGAKDSDQNNQERPCMCFPVGEGLCSCCTCQFTSQSSAWKCRWFLWPIQAVSVVWAEPVRSIHAWNYMCLHFSWPLDMVVSVTLRFLLLELLLPAEGLCLNFPQRVCVWCASNLKRKWCKVQLWQSPSSHVPSIQYIRCSFRLLSKQTLQRRKSAALKRLQLGLHMPSS